MDAYDKARAGFTGSTTHSEGDNALYNMIEAVRTDLWYFVRDLHNAANTCQNHTELRDDIVSLTREFMSERGR